MGKARTSIHQGPARRDEIEKVIRSFLKSVDTSHMDALMLMQQAFVYTLHRLQGYGHLDHFLDTAGREHPELDLSIRFCLTLSDSIQTQLIKNGAAESNPTKEQHEH